MPQNLERGVIKEKKQIVEGRAIYYLKSESESHSVVSGSF